MTDKVLIQVRLPIALVKELDRLLKEGYYRDRTEAIADAVRRLIERFAKIDRIRRIVRLYLMGKLSQDASIDEIGHLENVKDIRRAFINIYGTDNVDEILDKIRRRRL